MRQICKSRFASKFALSGIVVLIVFLSTYQWLFSRDVLFSRNQVNSIDQGTSYVEINFDRLDQHDPELIRYTRTRYLSPPPPQYVPYRLNNPKNPETGHGKWARKFFKNKRSGTFLEAGANEGEHHSHTLFLETDLNWTGLLIECNPTVASYLRTKKRKSWTASVCISTSAQPKIVNFSNPEKWSYSGRLGAAWNLPIPTNWTYFDVETVPLYTIIAAAGFKEIDFFSFDVEGVERDVLRDFPFDKIRFKLMIIEVYFLNETERTELDEFLDGHGYTVLERQVDDHIYAHKSVLAQRAPHSG